MLELFGIGAFLECQVLERAPGFDCIPVFVELCCAFTFFWLLIFVFLFAFFLFVLDFEARLEPFIVAADAIKQLVDSVDIFVILSCKFHHLFCQQDEVGDLARTDINDGPIVLLRDLDFLLVDLFDELLRGFLNEADLLLLMPVPSLGVILIVYLLGHFHVFLFHLLNFTQAWLDPVHSFEQLAESFRAFFGVDFAARVQVILGFVVSEGLSSGLMVVDDFVGAAG